MSAPLPNPDEEKTPADLADEFLSFQQRGEAIRDRLATLGRHLKRQALAIYGIHVAPPPDSDSPPSDSHGPTAE